MGQAVQVNEPEEKLAVVKRGQSRDSSMEANIRRGLTMAKGKPGDDAYEDGKQSFNVMIARFPHGGQEHPDVVDWLIPTVMAMKNDRRIKEIIPWRRDDTPITMSRNECMNVAKQQGADFVLMIDSDMCPDCNHKDTLNTPQWIDPAALKFWPTSWDFAYRKRLAGEPCVIGAPYCGPPPHENVYVFHWQTLESDRPADEIHDLSLEQYTREHAATLRGILPCAALPTGLIVIDMQAIEKLESPYFHYEWNDATEAGKASTEDVVFTRDLSMRGVEQYCNWDSWAGHWKRKLVGKPQPVTSKAVSTKFTNAVLRDHGINVSRGEKLMDVRDGKVKPLASARDDRPAGIA